ncbi:hypothetical protein SUBVAR_06483 [Subdoligranulum variabile DSM 15176]|uniref:Uncharacterized protein n=1 Tax=Subdoligranulum variabile DSM 15176 TaxID=411471 RepID=D1PQ16_9FIRM|nr:hypothetical protein SUBVAR_06483 [Subdoligranulum variabile DSM 15176]
MITAPPQDLQRGGFLFFRFFPGRTAFISLFRLGPWKVLCLLSFKKVGQRS